MNQLVLETDRLLKDLDREHGQNAIYYASESESVDVVTGEITPDNDPKSVRVRLAGVNSFDLSQLESAGLGRIDAGWLMRSEYQSNVASGDVLNVDGFDYEVIDKGASLDSLGLLWTIFTRRRT